MSHLAESASRSEAPNWDAVSAWHPEGKACPIPRAALGCDFRPQPPPPAFPQIKPAKIYIPFWQVLETDGEGDLMVVARYGSGASVGLGDGTHDG